MSTNIFSSKRIYMRKKTSKYAPKNRYYMHLKLNVIDKKLIMLDIIVEKKFKKSSILQYCWLICRL
jgi:hypothetical protein